MDTPLVSIIIPCYNARPWIADAIQSALSQTYSPVEVIVIDDGSTDSSRDIIKSFNGRVVSEFLDHGGASRARNRGLKLAKGEFVHFLDADDILFPSCVGQKMRAILKSGADLVYSGGFFYDIGANAGNYEPQAPPGNSAAETLAHVIVSAILTTLVLCRRTSLEAIGGFDEELVKGQEHDLLFRLALQGFKFAYLSEGLSLNRTGHNPSSISSIASRNPSRLETVLVRFEEKLRDTDYWTPQIRTALALRFYYLAVQYLDTKDNQQAKIMFQHAARLDRTHPSHLSFPRRCINPVIGGYLAERVLTKLRQLLPRSFEQKMC